MRDAVDVATAAAVDGVKAAAADSPGARGKDDSRGQWRKDRQPAQLPAARPFQTAAFEELKADGLADTFELANLFYKLNPTPVPDDVAASDTTSTAAAAATNPNPAQAFAAAARATQLSAGLCTPGPNDDKFEDAELLPYGLHMVGASDPSVRCTLPT